MSCHHLPNSTLSKYMIYHEVLYKNISFFCFNAAKEFYFRYFHTHLPSMCNKNEEADSEKTNDANEQRNIVPGKRKTNLKITNVLDANSEMLLMT